MARAFARPTLLNFVRTKPINGKGLAVHHMAPAYRGQSLHTPSRNDSILSSKRCAGRRSLPRDVHRERPHAALMNPSICLLVDGRSPRPANLDLPDGRNPTTVEHDLHGIAQVRRHPEAPSR